MKKLISLLLAIAMIGTLVPATALARNAFVTYEPVDGCRMTSISFTKSDNPWLLWDVTFKTVNDDETVLQTAKVDDRDHPNLVSAEVVPTIEYEGTLTFNGEVYTAGDAVTLLAENDIVITDDANHNRADYTLLVNEETNGLPVVLVDTMDADGNDVLPSNMTKEEYTDAYISVIGSDIYGADDIQYKQAGIKLRGNSTKGFAKKPFRIKFEDKQNVLGICKEKSWVLLADYLDPSALRNTVAYRFAQNINKNTAETTGFQVFAPRMYLVEVYVDGVYQGLYDMGDHMQAKKSRVNVDDSGDEFATDADGNEYQVCPEGDVGYFIEMETQGRVLDEGRDDSTDWSAYSYITNVGSATGTHQDPNDEDGVDQDALYFQFKLPEVPSDEQITYITKYLQNVNDKILKHDETVWDDVDMNSFVDWYLANETFKNADSQMQSSVYLYKDKGGKLFLGPVWDFDLSAGGVTYRELSDPTGWCTRNDEYCGWFRELFETDTFKNAVEERWAELHKEGILDQIFEDIAYYEEFASDAATENYTTWHAKYIEELQLATSTWLEVPAISNASNADWAAQVDYLEAYMKARIAWMDEQYGYSETTTVIETKTEAVDELTFTYNGTSSQTYTIDKDVPLNNLTYVLNMNSTAKWNFSFNYTVNFTIGETDYTITLTPDAKGDWQNDTGAMPFKGENSQPIAAGKYTDKELGVEGAIKWHLNQNYLENIGTSNFSLNEYVTSVHLNSVTVTLYEAADGNTATFSLTNNGKTALQLEKSVLQGKPTVMGSGIAGTTLHVSNTGILPFEATVEYTWYLGGTEVATGSSYTIDKYDGGKVITVTATATDAFTGSVTSDEITTQVYARSTVYYPSKLTVTETTSDSISFTCSQSGSPEFSIDGENWQSDTTFTNLNANTVYKIYIRGSAYSDGTATPGAISEPLVVKTLSAGTVQGDVNGTGTLDTTDASWVLDQALDFTDMKNKEVLELADYNGDDKINTLDARLILKALVNTI